MKNRLLLLTFALLAMQLACTVNNHNHEAGKVQGDGRSTEPRETQEQTPDDGTLQGTMDSGGGRAVVCKLPKGKISVQLLDLYEAENIQLMTLPKSPENLVDAWTYFITKYKFCRYYDCDKIKVEEAKTQTIAGWVKELEARGNEDQNMNMHNAGAAFFAQEYDWKRKFFDMARFVGDHVKLKQIRDSFEIFQDTETCKVMQLANYQSDETIVIQKSLWDKMDPLNQAALIAHEMLYAKYRKLGKNSSLEARRLVGYLFSTKKPKPNLEIKNPENKWVMKCNSVDDPSTPVDESGFGIDLTYWIRVDGYFPEGVANFERATFSNYRDQILAGYTELKGDPGMGIGIGSSLGDWRKCAMDASVRFNQTAEMSWNRNLYAKNVHFNDQLEFLGEKLVCDDKTQSPDKFGNDRVGGYFEFAIKSVKSGLKTTYRCGDSDWSKTFFNVVGAKKPAEFVVDYMGNQTGGTASDLPAMDKFFEHGLLSIPRD